MTYFIITSTLLITGCSGSSLYLYSSLTDTNESVNLAYNSKYKKYVTKYSKSYLSWSSNSFATQNPWDTNDMETVYNSW